MKPSDVLHELLGQHAQLRALLADVELYAKRCASGEGEAQTLKGCLASLLDSVRAHNRDEERLVGEALAQLDGWAERGARFMSEEHAREHADLHDALQRSWDEGDATRAGAIALALIERIDAHMRAEERIFLRSEVLRDDAGPAEG